jgi:hypothetical protein
VSRGVEKSLFERLPEGVLRRCVWEVGVS